MTEKTKKKQRRTKRRADTIFFTSSSSSSSSSRERDRETKVRESETVIGENRIRPGEIQFRFEIFSLQREYKEPGLIGSAQWLILSRATSHVNDVC